MRNSDIFYKVSQIVEMSFRFYPRKVLFAGFPNSICRSLHSDSENS